ncbi:hypothetical protein VTO73DRAFT_11501 [Trametes versicolor]
MAIRPGEYSTGIREQRRSDVHSQTGPGDKGMHMVPRQRAAARAPGRKNPVRPALTFEKEKKQRRERNRVIEGKGRGIKEANGESQVDKERATNSPRSARACGSRSPRRVLSWRSPTLDTEASGLADVVDRRCCPSTRRRFCWKAMTTAGRGAESSSSVVQSQEQFQRERSGKRARYTQTGGGYPSGHFIIQ